MTKNIQLIAKTGMKKPDADFWHPVDVVKDVLKCLNDLHRVGEYGPFTITFSGDWKPFLQNKYILPTGTQVKQTLKQRLESIEGVISVDWRHVLAGPFTIEINNQDDDLVLRGQFDLIENHDA